MAPFLTIANLVDLQKGQIKEMADQDGDWVLFREGELKESNEKNRMPLAGYQTAQGQTEEEEEEDNHYETSMDKLFATFTSVKERYDSSRSNTEEDPSVEDDDEN